jgi:hypothetical protein
MTTDLQQHVQCIADELTNGFDDSLEGVDGEFNAFDYLEGVLDVNWILNSDRSIRGAELLVAFGGPNIYVNTVTKTVTGYWGGDQATATFLDSVDLDEAINTWYNS